MGNEVELSWNKQWVTLVEQLLDFFTVQVGRMIKYTAQHKCCPFNKNKFF
jgi:hypothetical protein